MINIAICDDDVLTTTFIEESVYKLAEKADIKVNCDIYFDGNTIVDGIIQGANYDIIYLDIEMQKVNGISAAEQIRKMYVPVLIIYISSYEKYLKELFDVEPFRFLSKPIDSDKFCSIFWAAYKRIQEKNNYYVYVYNKVYIKIHLNHIYYFESNNRIISIHTISDKLINTDSRMEKDCRFYGKMNDVEKQLAGHLNFIRIHQSFLVNFAYIKRITFETVTMMDGKVLKISKERQKRVREKFCILSEIEA